LELEGEEFNLDNMLTTILSLYQDFIVSDNNDISPLLTLKSSTLKVSFVLS
jgi:hypothetical protein